MHNPRVGCPVCVRIHGSRSQVSVLSKGSWRSRRCWFHRAPPSRLVNARASGSTGSTRWNVSDTSALAWDKGMLLANNMRLDELLGELSRYRPGALRSPYADVAGLRVSGAFSLRGH